MSKKHEFLKQNSDYKLLRLDHFLKFLILTLIVIVVYDSIIHKTPLYYIGFYFLGVLVGRIILSLYKVQRHDESGKLTFFSGRINILITLLLIFFRFYFGRQILEAFHVIWVSDAIYLFFIGIYFSKWKGMIRKIDNLIYEWIDEK